VLQVVVVMATLVTRGALAAPSATGPLAFVHEAMAESAPVQMMRYFLPFMAPDEQEEEGEYAEGGYEEGGAPHEIAYGHDDQEQAAGGGLGHLGVLAPLLGASARVRETLAHAHNLVVSMPKRIATFVGLTEEEPEHDAYGE
jgi:hypothetical protein